jgi:hypothetical protein
MSSRTITLALIIGTAAIRAPAAVNRSIRTKRDASAGPIQRVCLVSLDAQLSRLGLKGMEPMPTETEEWAVKLKDTLIQAASGAGWKMAADFTDLSTVGEDARDSVVKVKRRYDTVAIQLNKKPGKVAKGRYTLGDEVALLPCSANADSLLFVAARGVVKTGGRQAFSMIVWGGVPGAFANYSLRIAFVDAKSGEVTALTRIALTGGKFGENPAKVLTKRLIEEFRKTGSGAN